MKPNFRMRPNSQKDVKVKNTTKKFVLEALKWGGGILLASLFLNVGCIKKEDPVKKYIQTLENNKDAFLDSEKESICFEAIYGLRSYRDDPRVVPALIKVLEENDSYWVQKLAASSLGEIKDPRAVPMLGKTLTGSAHVALCISAAWALGEICDPKAVPDLIHAFTVKKEQLEKLKEVTTGGGRDMYQEFIDRYDEVRVAIGTALEKIDQKHKVFPLPDISPIVELLEDWWSSYNAAWLLGKMRDKRAVSDLKRILNDPERYFEIPSNVSIVAWALGEIGDTSAVGALIKATLYKYDIAEALGKIGDRRAILYLVQYSKYKDPGVRYKATEALVKIDKEEYLPRLLKLLKEKDYWGAERVRDHVANFLVELKDQSTVPALIDALREDHEFITAARALTKLDKEKASAILIEELLNDKKEDVVWDAMIILGEMKEKRAIPKLIDIFKNKNNSEFRRANAISALGEIEDTTVLSFLVEVSKDTLSSLMAKSAQEAIDKIKSRK
jgi:HEAT repeat protein